MNNSHQNSKTCILYFTRGKSGVKSFSSNKRKSNAVQSLLFRKTLSEIRKSKLNYQISNGAAFGNDILDRLHGAVNEVFSLGFENVIVIGDDTPELSVKQIRQAEENLKQKKVTIGPSKDGGTYLIAFSKVDLHKDILSNLTWHSSGFREELTENLSSAHLYYELLTPFQDLDTLSDLFAFLSQTTHTNFFKILSSLINLYKRILPLQFLYLAKFYDSSFERGPPQVI